MPKKDNIIGKKIKSVPNPEIQIGIDTESTLQKNMLNALDNVETTNLDISSLESLNMVAQNRDQLYSLIETMMQDDSVSSIIETYTEDVVNTNDKGQSVWCESNDEKCGNYVTYILNATEVNKYIYSWAHSLITYGDVYLRLYRESDYGQDLIFNKNKLNEDIILKLHSSQDKYVYHVEMYPNPAEIFDATKFGKTAGYIQATTSNQNVDTTNPFNYLISYKMKRQDVTVYDATDFAHACLENNTGRNTEEISIFLNNDDYDSNSDTTKSTYKVRRGLPLLYNSFNVWRELSLLENSVLLSRITKSSIVRILNVDVGDMPKNQVSQYMQRLKSIIEQKSSLNINKSMGEYTNPGPVENIIYVPVHGTQGQITTSSVGENVDPKQLTDLEYFQNKFYGSARIPKAYFGITDDGAGFNGGQSLSIISSRYGKSVKRIQAVLCQLITDMVNMFLINRGMNNYINKFTIHMQPPITQEELDKIANINTKLQNISNTMQILTDVTDVNIRLKIVKSLLSNVIDNNDVLALIQEQIDLNIKQDEELKEYTIKQENITDINTKTSPEADLSTSESDLNDVDINLNTEEIEPTEPPMLDIENTNEAIDTDIEVEDDSYLPSPSELNIDLL